MLGGLGWFRIAGALFGDVLRALKEVKIAMIVQECLRLYLTWVLSLQAPRGLQETGFLRFGVYKLQSGLRIGECVRMLIGIRIKCLFGGFGSKIKAMET